MSTLELWWSHLTDALVAHQALANSRHDFTQEIVTHCAGFDRKDGSAAFFNSIGPPIFAA